MWIGSCVTASGINDFTLFLLSLTAALVQFALIALTSVCTEVDIWWDSVVVPVRCGGDFNGKYEGDAALAFVCGCHAVVVAAPVAAMAAARVWAVVNKGWRAKRWRGLL